jgi:F0F1-type ATP synthase membrane subunit a
MASPHISVAAETITTLNIPVLGIIDVTNAMLSALVICVVMCVSGTIIGQTLTNGKKISKVQHFLEGFLLYIIGVTGANLGSNKKAKQYLGLSLTLFLFIVLGSWFGLVPGVLDLKYGEYHIFRAPTTDLNACIALAIVAFLTVQIAGFKALGLGYLGKFFTIKGGAVGSAIGILEFFLEWARLLSYSFRLFGNIFAGEVLIIVLSYLTAPFWVPLPALVVVMETAVALIQGYVLISLMTVFVKMATESHDTHSSETAH